MLQKIFPDHRYQQSYLSHLSYLHRNFDVKGLTTQGVFALELEQVFVDLSLEPQVYNRASSDPLQLSTKTAVSQRQSLPQYLTSKKTKGQNLVMLGPPGSGKTTLLKHLTLILAAGKNGPEIARKIKKLPILLFLRNHVEAIARDQSYSLVTAVQSRLDMWDVAVPPDWLAGQLQKGRCLVMLDGLDEIADSTLRQKAVDWVDRQMTRYKNNQFVISSRPFGYRHNPLKDVVVLEVRPFTIEQVQQFVHNWYLANEIMSAQRDDPGVRMEAHKGAEDLIWRLRQTHVLLDMAVNPLLLTMIATVHRYRSSLPGRRVELYSEIVEVFLGKRQEARGITYELTPAQKQRVLETLAYYMMVQHKRELPLTEAAQACEEPLKRVIGAEIASQPGAVADFLKMIENTSGLLIEREAGLYGFAHLTFQEYLAAVHVRDQKLEDELVKHVQDSWWHETIRLYAAQSDATNVVKACLSLKQPSVVALTLAMECLEEAREVKPELRSIFNRIAQSVEHERPDVRRLAAEVLLTLRLRRLVRVDEDKYIDSSPVTHAEYQLFLEEESVYANYHVPEHWKTEQFPKGDGRSPVVGVRPAGAEAFCEWLTRRDAGTQWRFRLPFAEELESITQQSQARGHQMEEMGFWYRSGHDYKCNGFSLADAAKLQTMQRLLDQRITYDWALEERVKDAAPALNRARELILSRAAKRRFTLFDLGRSHDSELYETFPDLRRAQEQMGGAQAHQLDQFLSSAVDRAERLNVAEAKVFNLNYGIELIKALEKELAVVDNSDKAKDIIRQLDRNFQYALNLTRKQQVVMNPELIRALNNARNRAREAGNLLDRQIIGARTRTRSQLIQQIVALLRTGNGKAASPSDTEADKRRLAVYIDIYLDFALLEERVGQRLPVFEGIFLVRERV
ncbi:MAG: NACHT domain-containing protein [Ardenticatenaceae bacterium]|nr:NACHT domain-containing protein [Ardenticatenaceae bacterium]